MGVLIVIGCGTPGPSAPLAILDGAEAENLLQPCSRPAPSYDSLGRPAREVERAIAGLPGLPARERMIAQYAGFIRGGRRYVYGSYVVRDDSAFVADSVRYAGIQAGPWPLPSGNPLDWTTRALRVCHGGRASFGVEYDVGSGALFGPIYDVDGPPGGLRAHPSSERGGENARSTQ